MLAVKNMKDSVKEDIEDDKSNRSWRYRMP